MNTNFTSADDVRLPDHDHVSESILKKALAFMYVMPLPEQHFPLPYLLRYIIRPVFTLCTFDRVYVMYFVITISSAKLCRHQHLSEVAQGNTLGSGKRTPCG